MQTESHITLPVEQFNLLLEKICAMQKQINDLHTIVMSSTPTTRKEPKAKKPTKKEKVAIILAKRAFDSATKSN